MYLMGLGGKPVGECYMVPPDKEGVAWLMGHYYSGGNIKLLKFMEPVESPEEDSVEQRLRDLEDDMFYVKAYTEKFIKDLCESTGVTYKTIEEFMPEAGDPPEHTDSDGGYDFTTPFDTYLARK